MGITFCLLVAAFCSGIISQIYTELKDQEHDLLDRINRIQPTVLFRLKTKTRNLAHEKTISIQTYKSDGFYAFKTNMSEMWLTHLLICFAFLLFYAELKGVKMFKNARAIMILA